MKTMNDITLYDLMAEDLNVYMRKNSEFGYDLEIEDENSEMIVNAKMIHEGAIESFAVFCKQFLNNFNRVNGIKD